MRSARPIHLPLALRLAALALAAFAPSAGAQTPCDDALRAAQASFEVGTFEDVEGQLAPCRERAAPRAGQAAAWELAARSALALDRPAQAREALSALLRIDADFAPAGPPELLRLLAALRREGAEVQVASVSKTKESLREAPATVYVVTRQEIEERGYLDLEELLRDLPGFDVSRSNGEVYAHVYQRGFRSNNSDRNLLLLDGIEQNDLSTNIAHLSRQYPPSSLERVEVVYGPASTMYGANAYTGVINLVSRAPESLIPPGRRYGLEARATTGSFGTRSADLLLAGAGAQGETAWSVAGRFLRSDEEDLSRFPDWDYDYSGVDYRATLRLTGEEARDFCHTRTDGCRNGDPLFQATFGPDGEPAAIEPTALGVERARALDQALLRQEQPRYSDPTEDYSLNAKVRLGSLTLGLQLWHLSEGTLPSRTELSRANGSVAGNRQLSLFATYSRSLRRGLSLHLTSRYLQTGSDRSGTRDVSFRSYAGGGLDLAALAATCFDAESGTFVTCSLPAELVRHAFSLDSDQFATEVTLVHEPSERWSSIGGFSFRQGTIQSEPEVQAGSPVGHLEHTDLALFAQSSLRFGSAFKAVLGARLDHNQVHGTIPVFDAVISGTPHPEGFGTVLTSRAALLATWRGTVFKGVYAEAFKDPSDAEKFGTESGTRDFTSSGLTPERVRSLELSAEGGSASRLSWELSLFQSRYSDLVGSRTVTRCIVTGSVGGEEFCALSHTSGQFQNVGTTRIRGLQATARFPWRQAVFSANYTHVEPFFLDPKEEDGTPRRDSRGRPVSELRIGDIAGDRFNLAVHTPLWGRLAADLRLNYVGPRPTGADTTVDTNPYSEIRSHLVANLALTYRNLLPRTDLQLVVRNGLDAAYYDPGVLTAGDGIFAARIPQPGRTFLLRLSTGIGGKAAQP